MQVHPQQLAGQIKDQLQSVYVLGGVEVVVEDHASREIVDAAHSHGVENHEILRFDEGSGRGSAKAVPWEQVLDELDSSSLFGGRKLLEVRMRSASFNERGVTAVMGYAQNPSTHILLVRLRGLDRQQKRKKWYGHLRKSRDVVLIVADELNRQQSAQWLQRKAASLELNLTAQAAEKLADYTEGNLLAAKQELDIFQLLLEQGATIDIGNINLASVRNADVFEVMDALNARDAQKLAEKLDALQHQNRSASNAEFGVLTMLTQVLKLAHNKLVDRHATVPSYQRRVVDALIQRHSVARIEALLVECAHYNSVILGMARGDRANLLRHLLFAVAGVLPVHLAEEYHWRSIDRAVN